MKKYPCTSKAQAPEDLLYKSFEEKADEFVRSMLDNYNTQHYSSNKVIHDCVWGVTVFYPWELQVMDSPLMQRLRRINQLGLALYTYPSAHHSRFEHTLGVVAVASRMINSINSGMGGDNLPEFKIPDEHIYMIRMAALLHDVGHCFLSHLSESIYSEMEQFKELKNSFEIFKKAQAHEILGYIIVNTPAFRRFFNENTEYPYKGSDEMDIKLLLQNIGRIIIGAYVEPYKDSENKTVLPYYLTEIINGQFDADALDYLKRDSYATGLELTYNLDRFLYKIRIVENDELVNGEYVSGLHLTVPTSGITTVEEMMYNKQMLTRYIYQHQKVMTIDSLVWDMAQGLMRCGLLKHPCDFLYLTDGSIDMLQSSNKAFMLPIADTRIADDSNKTVAELARRISTRKLPKKAFVINSQTIKSINGQNECTMSDISDFVHGCKHDLRREIYEEALRLNKELKTGLRFDMYDIHVAVPKFSLAKDYSSVYVISNDNRLVPISEVVNLNALANTYANYSWNSYIFAETDILPVVSLAAKNVLEKHGAEFYDNAFSHLKHANEIHKLTAQL